jgi:Secretion system C-terminal sorting domain
VGTVYNTNKPGFPSTTTGHSYQAGLPSGWHNSGCDWIIEAVVEYHKDKVNSIIEQNTDILPKRSFLQQNYPNPFNASETQINYTLQSSGFVEINIYSINGKRFATLVGEQQNKGSFSTKLNISELASGTYFYTLLIDQIFQDSKKMILVK